MLRVAIPIFTGGLPCVFVYEEMLLAWVLKVSVRKLRFRLRLDRKIEECERLKDEGYDD
jgi:hypothetical protein